jgi:hypothetical protein
MHFFENLLCSQIENLEIMARNSRGKKEAYDLNVFKRKIKRGGMQEVRRLDVLRTFVRGVNYRST